jgi:tRNA/tmRNA/rRNA uracil-C5-methylase (TrmA/RlmC/RlmD family)
LWLIRLFVLSVAGSVEVTIDSLNAAGDGVATCDGCTWQHISYPEQLRLKTALVERLVRGAVACAPRVQPMLPSTAPANPWPYRHNVHFV